jgi:multiple sugar transport system ATP-binding protein
MNDRKIQQVGAPMELYTRPANSWVARFVGSPAMTLAPGVIAPGEGRYARVRLAGGAEVETRVVRDGLADGAPVELGLRSEYVTVTAPGSGTVDADASLVERLGDRTLVYARLSDGLEVTAQDEGSSRVKIGDRIGLKINGAATHLFGPDGVGRHAEASAA